MCTRGLPDIYTLSPRACGPRASSVYIRQTTRAHGITIKCIPLSFEIWVYTHVHVIINKCTYTTNKYVFNPLYNLNCIIYYYTDKKEEAGCSCTLEDILVFFLVLKGYHLVGLVTHLLHLCSYMGTKCFQQHPPVICRCDYQ